MSEPSVSGSVTDTPRPASGPGAGKGRAPGCRRTQFRPGNPGPPGLRKESEDVVYEAGTPLDDVRFVLGHPKTADVTPGQKAARKLLERDYRGFVLLLEKLEGGERVASEEAGEGSEAQVEEQPIEDAGARRVGELVERKLRELRQSMAS
jgi:hypothetical protein